VARVARLLMLACSVSAPGLRGATGVGRRSVRCVTVDSRATGRMAGGSVDRSVARRMRGREVGCRFSDRRNISGGAGHFLPDSDQEAGCSSSPRSGGLNGSTTRTTSRCGVFVEPHRS